MKWADEVLCGMRRNAGSATATTVFPDNASASVGKRQCRSPLSDQNGDRGPIQSADPGVPGGPSPETAHVDENSNRNEGMSRRGALLRATVMRFMRGDADIRLDTADTLAAYFGVSVSPARKD